MTPKVWAVALLLCLSACGRVDAEDWAKDTLGESREGLRKEALDRWELVQTESAGLPTVGTVWLPRPMVVLEPPPRMGEIRKLRYHRVNAKLSQPVQSATDVRGIAVVSYGIWDASRYERTKTGHTAWIPDGKPYISVVAIDRAKKQGKIYVAAGDGDDRVIEILEGLPDLPQ